MAKTLAQLIDPTLASLIPQLTIGGGVNPQQQMALLVVGKVYALKAAGGTDYTSNHLQLFQDVESSVLGESPDVLMATRVNVWLQAMACSGAPTLTASGTPPVSASAALALVKLTLTRDMDTLMSADTYLDALLVQQVFAPAKAALGAPLAPTLLGYATPGYPSGSHNNTTDNGVAVAVLVTSNSTPDVGGNVVLYHSSVRNDGTHKVAATLPVASLPTSVDVSVYTGQHIWGYQFGGGTTYVGISPITATDITVA